MKIIVLIFIILLFFLLILIFPFRLRFLGHLNLISMVCVYSIKVMFIRLLIGRISFNLKNGFIVENQINNLPKDDINHPHLMNLFAKQVVCHVEVDKLKMFYNFGISTNAEATANTTGTIYVLSSIIFGYVLSVNPMARITESFVPTFNENSLETTIVVSFKINILNIIISYFEAKKKYKIKFKGAK